MSDRRLQVVWTVLPATGDERQRVIVVPSLRLLDPSGADLTLADFDLSSPDPRGDPRHCWTGFTFAGQWRLLLAQDGGAPAEVEAFLTLPDGWTEDHERRMHLWAQLFPPTTFVRPWTPDDMQSRPIHSFPAQEVLVAIHDAYKQAGDGFDGRKPPRDELSRILRDARTADSGFTGGEPSDDLRGRPRALALVRRFYERSEFAVPYQERPTLDSRPFPPVPRIDFHQMLSLLGDHPFVLRLLGLIAELFVPALKGSEGTLQAVPPWHDPRPAVDVADVCPVTRWTTEGRRLQIAPGRRFRGATLDISAAHPAPESGEDVDARYFVSQLDLDGAALKLMATARSIALMDAALQDGTAPFDAPSEETLAALRSDGLALIERDRGAGTRAGIDRAAALTGADAAGETLDADDLIRGLRVDVLDDAVGKWHSLCRRRAVYTLGDTTLEPVEDEGYVKRSSATSGPQANGALYLHEVLARWQGWSQVVARPDRPIEQPGDPLTDPGRDPPSFAFQPEITAPPGSLPRLRFGRSYRLRVRLADLAGCGLTPDEIGDADGDACAPMTYRRFDPVPPPELVPTRPYEAGESFAAMAIRSDRGVGVAAYARRHGLPTGDARQVLAPKTSQQLAEQHSAFDAALGPDASAQAVRRAFELATLADRTLADVPGSSWVHPQDAPVVWRDRRAGSYMIVPPKRIKLPWLPDPIARGFVLRQGDESLQDHRWEQWPKLEPVLLRLEDGEQRGLEWDGKRTLVARLPPAEEMMLDVASFVDDGDLTLLGVASWLDPGQAKLATRGAHWMITPPRPLRLVHAVQHPLRDPEGTLAPAPRDPGSTSVLLQGSVRLHGRSTGQLEVRARCSEWVDRPDWRDIDALRDQPGAQSPARVDSESHVAWVAIDPALPEHAVPFPPPPAPSPRPGAAPPATPEVRHEFGDTRHRDLRYDLVAVSRFHEFFPAAELGEDAFTARTELPDPHSIPSSARPPAPVVDALVPTVRWEGDAPRAGWTKIRRTRLGDGVRIYLDRPWYASGDGELLALLLPEGDEGPAPEVAPLMTAWGADPIWKAPEEFAGGPLIADELAATAGDPVTQLPLVDRPGTVTAIPYAVEWNAERGRWYADVELAGSDETNYAPFLRLGLARYQPNSISPDVALSAPVDGGFVQLLPVRRLTADRHPDGTITVTIDGPAPAGPDHNWLELSIEVQGDQPSGELGWQPWSERVPTLVAMDAMPVRAAVAAPGDVQGSFRLVVREYERHPADTEVADGRGDGTTRDRVVFAEVLAL